MALDENARLQKLFADQMLNAAAMRELLEKSMVPPLVQGSFLFGRSGLA
jgi:hypothetical protein